MLNKHWTWRIVDGMTTFFMGWAAAHWGNVWLALAALAYGLWNYVDGLLRSRWKL